MRAWNKTYLSGADSRLIRRAAGYFSGQSCLEIGIGYGSNLTYLHESFAEVTGTDIEKTIGSGTGGANLVVSDSGACFRDGRFDLVLINPPYVPSDDIIDRTVDGGKDGLEVAEKFLIEASRLINESGKILILLSSLNPIERFARFCWKRNLRFEIIEKESLFFEILYVFLVQKQILSEEARMGVS